MKRKCISAQVLSLNTWKNVGPKYTLPLLPHIYTYIQEQSEAHLYRKILNVGAGQKSISYLLQIRLPQAQIADIDITPYPKSIRWSPFIRGDCHRLPFKDNCMDMILSTFTFVYGRNQRRIASEWLRVLKPGQPAFLLTHSPWSIHIRSIIKQRDYAEGLLTLESRVRTLINRIATRNDDVKLIRVAHYISHKLGYHILPERKAIHEALDDYRHRLKTILYINRVRYRKLFYHPQQIQHFFQAAGFSSVRVWTVHRIDGLKQTNSIDFLPRHDAWFIELRSTE